MGMKACLLPLALVAAAALFPARAAAASALSQASEPVNFDGAAPRPAADAVRAGSTGDGRTAAQIAKDEQVKADARAATALTAKIPGPDSELEPPKPNEWIKPAHILSGVTGALFGLLVGSLWGLTGLGIGALVGGLIGYAVSRLAP